MFQLRGHDPDSAPDFPHSLQLADPGPGRAEIHLRLPRHRGRRLVHDTEVTMLSSNGEIIPLMPKRYFSTSIYFIVFKKQKLQAANTDLNCDH